MAISPADGDPVLAELDACMETMSAMQHEISELRAMLKQTTDMLTQAMSIVASKAPEKRARGRPRKVIDDSWMVDAFSGMKAEFIAANKFQKPTDNAVLTWYFEQLFARHGLRVSKVKSAEYQGKLKRLKNRLGDVRNPIVKSPIK